MAFDLGQLVPIGLAIGVGFLLMRGGGCCGVPARRPAERPADAAPNNSGAGQPTDPLQELKLRLARGEIDVNEYERRRAFLES